MAAVLTLGLVWPVGAASAAAEVPIVRVVLEFADAPAMGASAVAKESTASVRSRVQAIQAAHDRNLHEARQRGLQVAAVAQFSLVFNGLAVEVPADQVQALGGLPGVVAVHPDQEYAVAVEQSVPHIGAPEVWRMHDAEGRPVTGSGMVVAVIDTGVDYTHPDLGGGIGPDHKVIGGYDFVNRRPDPRDDNGHGTHVAGIIAGNGSRKGVAPDARIVAYKVLNRFGSGQLVNLLEAIEAAADPDNPYGVDVINLSLGGPVSPDDPVARAAANAALGGLVVIASAGNSGPGAFTVGSPAVAPGVLAVGASTSGVVVPRVRLVSPPLDLQARQKAFSATPEAGPEILDVVDVGRGRPEDYADKSVEGVAVLVESEWGVSEEVKAAVAADHGARLMLLYLRQSGGIGFGSAPGAEGLEVGGAVARLAADQAAPAEPSAQGHDFTVGLVGTAALHNLVAVEIPFSAARTVQDQLANGRVRVEMTGIDLTDQIAAFSSRGPTPLFAAKPDLVAPGVSIQSAVPRTGALTGTRPGMPG